ncbi:MAG: isopentenyl phosphate kinase [Patescibacteria group bacterium]
MKNITAILKLGGSIITYKNKGRPGIKTAFVRKVAKELSQVLKNKSKIRLILLYGAGSFAHPLVYKYRLKNQPLKNSSFIHIGEVINSMRELGTQLARIFAKEGLPIIPLQTSSLIQKSGEKSFFKNFSALETTLLYQGIPLLGGDIAVGGSNKVNIISADEIAVLLSKHFKNSRIFFATDINGVYKNFPPLKKEKPLKFLNRATLKLLAGRERKKLAVQKYDVTGSMIGKLKNLLSLQNREVFIFNGQKPLLIKKALEGEKMEGTTVLL